MSYICPSKCKHHLFSPDTTLLLAYLPETLFSTPIPHFLNFHKPRYQTLCPSCTFHKGRSLSPSHFTSHHGWLWTWKCKCCQQFSFFVPEGFKWDVVQEVRLGAFALDQFNLPQWWWSSSLVLMIGTLLPGMHCPWIPDIVNATWTVDQWAAFTWFLDAVWAFLCCKILSIVWGFETPHVAVCNNLDFCIVVNFL